jgi:hypothetical protein
MGRTIEAGKLFSVAPCVAPFYHGPADAACQALYKGGIE